MSLHAPYTVHPFPNYSGDTGLPLEVLTDGKTGGPLGGAGKYVGWQNRSPIIFRQRYQNGLDIGRVEIDVMEKVTSEIRPPSHAFVYVADRSGRFEYVGDAAQQPAAAPILDLAGTRTLSLDFSARMAHEVMIVLFRDATYLLLYEIRIRAGRSGVSFSGKLESDVAIADALARRRALAFQRAGTQPLGRQELAERFAWPLPQSADARANSPAACEAVPILPWGSSLPEQILAMPRLVEPGIHVTGGWLTGAIRIANATEKEQTVTLTAGPRSGVGEPQITLAHYVLGLDYRWRADVLVPASDVVLPPRSFALVMLRAAVQGTGEIDAAITVGCDGSQHSVTLPGRAIGAAPDDRPHGNLWSYLMEPTVRAEACWPQLHDDMWIDTAVTHMTAVNLRINSQAKKELRTYLRKFSSARRIILEMEMGMDSAKWPTDADSPRTQMVLSAWWAWVDKIIREEGYKGQILIYPMDEPSQEQIAKFNAISRLLRKIAPQTPIYVTIGHKLSSETLLSLEADTIQLLDRFVDRLTPPILKTKQVEIYATNGWSKTLDPNGYFRRLSWTAFDLGLSGVGIWSMHNSSGAVHPEHGWSDFSGNEVDFGLLYAGQNGCVHASRRLLAFQRGLEDFAVMRSCARQQPGDDQGNRVRGLIARTDADPADYDKTLHSLAAPCLERARGADTNK